MTAGPHVVCHVHARPAGSRTPGQRVVKAADERVLSRVVVRYGRLDLVLLEEFGYVQIDLNAGPSRAAQPADHLVIARC